LWAALAIVAASALTVGPNGLRVHERWSGSWHRFTWGAKINAIGPPPPPLE